MKPTSNSIECKMKFDIPSGYFDTLADNVMQRVEYEDRQKARRKTKRVVAFRSIMAAAACLIAVVAVRALLMPNASSGGFSGQADYIMRYTENLEIKCTDFAVLDCMSSIEQSASNYSDGDMLDFVSDYPSPVTYIYE